MTPAKQRLPLPGRPVRGSARGRPVMALLDLLGRRWSLRVLWQLRDGAQTFRVLQAGADGLSPSILNIRLKELREARLVESGEAGYVLTASGTALLKRLAPVAAWADEWAASLAAPAAQARAVKARAVSPAVAAARRR
jgi:DNA-binding HxlR family transcriptional regulator